MLEVDTLELFTAIVRGEAAVSGGPITDRLLAILLGDTHQPGIELFGVTVVEA